MPGSKITLNDVAAHARVSRATVSLVIRESPLVASETRARVLASMKALGYVYHRRAASLRSERTHTIGLLVTNVSNPFFAELTTDAEAELNEAGFVILLGHNYESVDKQSRWVRVMLEYGVDGVIICPAHGTTPDMLKPLTAARMPHLLLARCVEGHEASYVGADNVLGASLATAHLLNHGCRRIVFLGGPETSTAWRDRQHGVAQTLAERGRVPGESSLATSTSRQSGYQAAAQVLAAPHVPDGIVCYNDIVAFGVLAAIRDRGLVAGADVRVIGFDDIEESSVQYPSLTSVGVAPPALGLRAARLLRQLIEDKSTTPRTEIAQPVLTARASCGCHST